MNRISSLLGGSAAVVLVGLLLSPLIALVAALSPSELVAGMRHGTFLPAVMLSLGTSATSLAFVVLGGTPLAWWLSRSRSSVARAASIVVDIPIVIPPAVVGLGLLLMFGRHGLLGAPLGALDISVPFTTAAVIIAQVVVSAPFFVQAATSAFRRVEEDTLIVARTLGASPAGAFFRVALPTARPGLLAGASLAWARALGEFGATLLFAGNLPGTTQTMPLAIYAAFESDLDLAVAFALSLAVLGTVLLATLRLSGPRPDGRAA